MNIEQFHMEFNRLRVKYNLIWEWDCDLQSLITGMVFYKKVEDEKPFCHIQGIYVDKEFNLTGDFEGFIRLLEEVTKDEYGY